MKTLDMYELYERILQTREPFPSRSWVGEEGKLRLQKLLRYLIIEKLGWAEEEFRENYCLPFLYNYRLGAAFRIVYSSDLPQFAQDTFPEWQLYAWNFKKITVKNTYWNLETMKMATKWIVEEVLQWDLDRVNRDISNKPFVDNGLTGMLATLKVGAIQAVVTTYPDYDWTYLIERRGYRLTKEQVSEIKALYKVGFTQAEIMRKTGIESSLVNQIVRNKIHRD